MPLTRETTQNYGIYQIITFKAIASMHHLKHKDLLIG